MEQLIAYLQNFFGQYITQATNKANAVLQGLPPIEQVEAASEAGFALRQARGAAQSVLACLADADAALNGIYAEAKSGKGDLASKINGLGAQLAQAAVTAKLTGGEFFTKADFDAAVENARSQAITAERTKVAKDSAAATLIAGRRTEVIASGLSAALLDAATGTNAELLTGDDYLAKAAIITTRIGKLNALGIVNEDALKDFAAIGLNQEGDAEFERRLGIQQKVATDIQKIVPGAKRAPFVAGVHQESGAKVYTAI